MRTTVTLDDDVERLLREAVGRTRQSFKETLNNALRAGLLASAPAPPREPFVVRSRPMGLRPGIDPAGLNRFVDDLETEEFIEKTGAKP